MNPNDEMRWQILQNFYDRNRNATTKRCYGVKSSDTLWKRLILDLNRASEAVGRSIAELREMVSDLKAVFLAFCT